MNLVKLRIWNFLSIGYVERDLAQQGLVLLTGENLDDPSADSNGSGKSSLPESIVWCLYGKTIRGIRTNEVINRQVGKDCRVELDLTVAKGRVQVRRCRADSTATDAKGNKEPNQFRIWLNNQDVSSNDTDVTQATLVDLLGMDYDQFVRLVIIGQGFENRFTAMSDRALKEFIEARTGSVHYAKAYDLADTELASTQGHRNGLDNGRNALQQGLADSRRMLVEEQQRVEAATAERDEKIAGFQKTFADQQVRVAELDAQKRLHDEEKTSWEDAEKSKLAELDVQWTQTEQEHLHENESMQNERTAMLETHKKSMDERVAERLRQQRGYEGAVAKLQGDKLAVGDFIPTTVVPGPPESGTTIMTFQIGTAEEEMVKLKNNEPCSKCGYPLSPEACAKRVEVQESHLILLRAHLSEAQRQEQAVADVQAAIEVERQRYEQGLKAFDDLVQQKWNEMNAALAQFDVETQHINSSNFAVQTEFEQRRAPISERQAAEVANVNAERAAIRNEYGARVRELNQKILDTGNLKAQEAGIGVHAQGEIRVLEAQDLESGLRDLNARVADSEAQVAELSGEIAKLDDRLYCLNYIVKAFGLTGIRSFMLDNVLVYLNERLREHCSTLFDGRTMVALSPTKEKKKGGLTQKITLDVQTDGGSYKASSGGERRKVDVAVFLAFRDLNRKLTPVQINLEAYDEILSFLDGESASRVVSLLLDDPTVDTKILITHRTDIPIVGRYQTWKAVKQHGITSYVNTD
ncbi:hypothetical protein LCGC14_0165410 [marine sediment metagenome]|uniref:Rad50/SbcC-type AAA domain-containing protein n=1 Tax=marine sediment metagenome TaxID=412755 RepID=A0A0F9VAW3_9ZZZZ